MLSCLNILCLGFLIVSIENRDNNRFWFLPHGIADIYSHSSLMFAAAAAKLLQSCPTLCDPIDGSPPGSPVPGILQARTLEWVAISFSVHESEK